MEEKKLTDEELIKALIYLAETGECRGWIDGYKCKVINFNDILNFIHRLESEKSELQKQVDELRASREIQINELHEQHAIVAETIKQDTAQNVLEEFICRLVNSRLVGVNDDLYVELLETKDDLLKEKYGVEVE